MINCDNYAIDIWSNQNMQRKYLVVKNYTMNIFWLSHLIPYPPQGGGVLQRSYNLLKIAADKHDVTLLAFNQLALSKIISGDK